MLIPLKIASSSDASAKYLDVPCLQGGLQSPKRRSSHLHLLHQQRIWLTKRLPNLQLWSQSDLWMWLSSSPKAAAKSRCHWRFHQSRLSPIEHQEPLLWLLAAEDSTRLECLLKISKIDPHSQCALSLCIKSDETRKEETEGVNCRRLFSVISSPTWQRLSFALPLSRVALWTWRWQEMYRFLFTQYPAQLQVGCVISIQRTGDSLSVRWALPESWLFCYRLAWHCWHEYWGWEEQQQPWAPKAIQLGMRSTLEAFHLQAPA